MGVRGLHAVRTDALALDGSSDDGGRQGLPKQTHRRRARVSDEDPSLFHPGRHRRLGRLRERLPSALSAARNPDDALLVRRARSRAHRRLFASHRDARPPRVDLQRVYGIRGDGRQARLLPGSRKGRPRPPGADRGLLGLHRRHAALFELRDASELHAKRHDEGHGPDHRLVDRRRNAPYGIDDEDLPRIREGKSGSLDGRLEAQDLRNRRNHGDARRPLHRARLRRDRHEAPHEGRSARLHPLHRRPPPRGARPQGDLRLGRQSPSLGRRHARGLAHELL